MVAKDINVRLIASGIMGQQKSNSNEAILKAAAHPASALVMELFKDKSDKLVVEAQFNDADIQLGGCTAAGPCDAQTFMAFLEKQIALIPDVKAACQINTVQGKEIIQ